MHEDVGGGPLVRGLEVRTHLVEVAADCAAAGRDRPTDLLCPREAEGLGLGEEAARQLLDSPLVRIETMGSYNCRNVAGSAKRSAHATANAIDVSAFVLADGRRISVQGDWAGGTPAEKQFLRIVHTSACKRFGTVLGPGYNAAHQDHFHLESGGKSFCR